MHRKPAVAGSFYPDDPQTLRKEVEACLGALHEDGGGPEREGRDEPAQGRRERTRAVAALVPHAGYMYSGPCAGATYAQILVPSRVVVLGPNHTGLGSPLSLLDSGAWDTPLGAVPLDAALGARLRRLDRRLRPDPLAHQHEHSIEVQLPFLQVLSPAGLRFLPICVGTRRIGDLLELGDALAAAIREEEEDILIVISSDMSHYISWDEARARDAGALARMAALDAEGLHEIVEREEISMCGYCPAVVGIRAARALGAAQGRLSGYTSSGAATGDYESVVAYAGLIFN